MATVDWIQLEFFSGYPMGRLMEKTEQYPMVLGSGPAHLLKIAGRMKRLAKDEEKRCPEVIPFFHNVHG